MPSTITIAISGGSCSGKKRLQSLLASHLTQLSSTELAAPLHITLLHQSSFPNNVVAPDPEALEAYNLDALAADLTQRKLSLQSDSRKDVEVIIVEGAYLFTSPSIVASSDIKIFIDCDPDVRLARRVQRDLGERGLPIDTVFEQYVKYGKSSFERHVLPTKVLSDIILPGQIAEDAVGVELVVQGVMDDVRASSSTLGKGTVSISRGKRGPELPLTLCEAELISGAPEYYDTV